jgi:SPP1 gp7 family putative phage head morphogenesis protein
MPKDPRLGLPRRPTVNETLLDSSIRHGVGLQRYSAGLQNKITAILNRADADIEATLLRRYSAIAGRGGVDTGPATTARLEQIRNEIRGVLDGPYDQAARTITGSMQDLVQHEAAFQAEMITSVVPINVSFTIPSMQQLMAVVDTYPLRGRLMKDWASSLKAGQVQRIDEALKIGYVNGETVDQMARRIRGTKAAGYSDGVLEVGRREAQAIVRTAVSGFSARAREITYAENDDLVTGVTYVATLDGRTTPICRSLDGKVFPPNEGPRPPQHWGCRSSTAPALVPWKELGVDVKDIPESTRASMDGQVPESTTYQTWLFHKPAEFQDDILGPTRGKLFRSGGLTLDRFVDKAGRQYTLDELRRHDAEAFKKAGLDN